MINKKAIPDLELSLCSKCASVYYNDKSYFIERADYSQTIFEECKIASFTLTIDDAKKYLYSFSTRRRVYNWKDLNVSIWI